MVHHPSWVAGQARLQRGQGGQGLFTELSDSALAFVVIADGDLGSQTQGDDEGNGQSAGPQTALLTTAPGQGTQGWAVIPASAGDQRANALGREEFVAAETDQVDAGMAQGGEVLAVTLGGVGVKISGMIFEKFGNFGERLTDAGFVVDLHDGDQQGIGLEGSTHHFGIDPAASSDRQVGHAKSIGFEGSAGFQYGFVFDGGGDDMPLALLQTGCS